MKWYLKVVRDNYANFNGRARRQEYWMFVLINLLISIAITIVIGGLAAMLESPAIALVSYIYSLGVIIPSIAVAIRRLHDINKSGWYLLVSFIPIAGAIWLLILLATEGDSGQNEYGEDPKGDEIKEIGQNEIY